MFEMSRSPTGPFIRAPSRSDENASLVRATPRRLRCVLWTSSAIEWAKIRRRRQRSLRAAVLLAERDLARGHLDQPHLDDDPCRRSSVTVPTTTPSAPSSFQRRAAPGRRTPAAAPCAAMSRGTCRTPSRTRSRPTARRRWSWPPRRRLGVLGQRNELRHRQLRRPSAEPLMVDAHRSWAAWRLLGAAAAAPSRRRWRRRPEAAVSD